MSKEKPLEQAPGDLAAGLRSMHATLLKLITGLRNTRLSRAQSKLVNGALIELHRSQSTFYGDRSTRAK